MTSRKKNRPSGASMNSTVPAPVYPIARAAFAAASHSAARSSGPTAGDGASSTIFWWRRWIEHSRSPSAQTPPCASATICTSMWRAFSSSGSQNTVGSPNADSASRRAPATASASSSGARTTRMPRPPPPADAFTSSGKSAAVTRAGSSSGSTGTSAAAISFFASILEPIAAIASGGGPIQVSPAPVTARANSAFSDRNP